MAKRKKTRETKLQPIDQLQQAVNQIQAEIKELPKTIKRQAQETRDSIKQVPENIVETVRQKAEPLLLDPFTEALREIFQKLTEPLRDLLSPVLELLQLARLLKDEVLEVEKRLDYVTGTLRFLFPGAGKQLEEIRDAFKALLEPGDMPRDLLRLLGALLELNPTVKSMKWVTECALQRKLILPERPAGFYPGRLYEFIHGENLDDGERAFRLELLGALDRYFRGASADGGPAQGGGATPEVLSGVDGNLAVKSLTDLVGIIIQTTLGFVFRPPHLASRIAPRMSLLRPTADPNEALARDASFTLSRSVSQPIHALGGLVFRGGWEVNTFNESLVEVVVGGIKSLVASLAESLLHSVLSLVEIREVYADPALGAPGEDHIWSWSTRSRWGGEEEVVFQEVVLGSGVPDQPKGLRSRLAKQLRAEIKGKDLLKDILRDYATYRELALINREPDLANSAISVGLAWANDGLEVEASFSHPTTDPGVVLRAFAGGRVEIMPPPEEGVHRVRLDNVGREQEVHVLAGLTMHGSSSLVA